MKLINIGFGSLISDERLLAIVSADSAPIKRMIQDARERGMLVDATYGRKTKSVLLMDSDHVILAAITPETVAERMGIAVERYEEEGERERSMADCLCCPVLPVSVKAPF